MSDKPTVPGAEWVEKARALHVQFDRANHEWWARDVGGPCPVCESIALALESEASARASAEQEAAALRKQLTEAMDRSARDHMRDADRVAEITRQREEAERLGSHAVATLRGVLRYWTTLPKADEDAIRETIAAWEARALPSAPPAEPVCTRCGNMHYCGCAAPPATPETPMEFPTATQPCSYCGRPYGSSYGGSQDITGTREYWTHVRCYVPKPAPATAEPAREKCNGFHAADCGHTVACDLYAVPDTPRDEKEKI